MRCGVRARLRAQAGCSIALRWPLSTHRPLSSCSKSTLQVPFASVVQEPTLDTPWCEVISIAAVRGCAQSFRPRWCSCCRRRATAQLCSEAWQSGACPGATGAAPHRPKAATQLTHVAVRRDEQCHIRAGHRRRRRAPRVRDPCDQLPVNHNRRKLPDGGGVRCAGVCCWGPASVWGVVPPSPKPAACLPSRPPPGGGCLQVQGPLPQSRPQ